MPLHSNHRSPNLVKLALLSLTAMVSLAAPRISAFAADVTYPECKIKVDILQIRNNFASRVPAVTQSTRPLPDFPLPSYPRATVTNFTKSTTSSSPVYSGTILTQDPPQTPYAWYKQILTQNNWTIKQTPPTPAEKSGRILLLTAEKDGVNLTIACGKPAKGDSFINISTMAVPNPGK